MSVVESVAAVLTAAGGLGGLATLINAISTRRAGEGPKTEEIAAEQPRLRDDQVTRWCLISAAVAFAFAVTLVIVVGRTSLALDQIPVALVQWGVVAFAASAIITGAQALRRAVRERDRDRVLYVGAGLVAAFGALTATLIAGTG